MNVTKLPQQSEQEQALALVHDHDKKLDIAEWLKNGNGGHFAQGLGNCLIYADSWNLNRVAKAFPDIILDAWRILQRR